MYCEIPKRRGYRYRLATLTTSADGTVVVTTLIRGFLQFRRFEIRPTSETLASARRARQASRAAAPRFANRVARARDEKPSSNHIQVHMRCRGRAAQTRREELSMACCREPDQREMVSGMDGAGHKVGWPFEAITCGCAAMTIWPSMPMLETLLPRQLCPWSRVEPARMARATWVTGLSRLSAVRDRKAVSRCLACGSCRLANAIARGRPPTFFQSPSRCTPAPQAQRMCAASFRFDLGQFLCVWPTTATCTCNRNRHKNRACGATRPTYLPQHVARARVRICDLVTRSMELEIGVHGD